MLESCDDESDVVDDKTQAFKRYDIVSIEKNKERAKKLQENHGGWNPKMSSHSLISPAFIQVLGLKGIVNKVDGDGDVLVECINSTKYAGDRAPFAQWFFNPNLLTPFDTSDMTFQDGDFVLVIDSYQKVKALQDSAHGGWNEKMRESLGKAGIVSGVLSNGRIKVKLGSRPWVFNKEALRLIAKSEEMMQAVLQGD
ncbi:hypothetical protein NP493_1479g00003 [Ridgeia piscesae]|uniref:Mind bomb SH3 repeat domain-containing protein n=1 Tax=Ridgeia piscesae TaxID=27915 RepID=A0AAD9K1P6_RIDPI|nr:hypothetical protein NP493_1479g00003 [Ridgeia piscesae]